MYIIYKVNSEDYTYKTLICDFTVWLMVHEIIKRKFNVFNLQYSHGSKFDLPHIDYSMIHTEVAL